jgi:sensor histidine kinase YesM
MIIQPHVENAIWHGLRYLEKKGLLVIHFSKTEQNLVIIIDDNGIGISKSNALKTYNQKEQKSIGTNNIHERIKLLNTLYNCSIQCDTKEKTSESGTHVTITIPLNLANNKL